VRLLTLHAAPHTDPGIRVAELGASVRGTPICQRGIRILLLTGSPGCDFSETVTTCEPMWRTEDHLGVGLAGTSPEAGS
jgi:hypothetical protein